MVRARADRIISFSIVSIVASSARRGVVKKWKTDENAAEAERTAFGIRHRWESKKEKCVCGKLLNNF